MPNQSTMDERSETARRAANDIERWLRARSKTIEVINVEDDPDYQEMDIDLVCRSEDRQITIEIKGDTWHHTGNFFLETHSNEEKNTPGCFMYTAADYVFYYFVETKVLYIMPMPETRTWFEKHRNEFREARTQTRMGAGRYYTTVGRLVPISILTKNIPRIKKYQL